jgi:serine/threonine protein kinase
MSPEALQSNIYTAKNDIWSIGVIFYEMLHGKAPWSCTSEKQLIEEINRNSISLLKGLSDDLKDFIRKCLTPDEKKRLNLKDIINHPLANRLITETGPLLLRKITSINENQDFPAIQTENQNQGLNKPKVLHHRNHKEYTP